MNTEAYLQIVTVLETQQRHMKAWTHVSRYQDQPGAWERLMGLGTRRQLLTRLYGLRAQSRGRLHSNYESPEAQVEDLRKFRAQLRLSAAMQTDAYWQDQLRRGFSPWGRDHHLKRQQRQLELWPEFAPLHVVLDGLAADPTFWPKEESPCGTSSAAPTSETGAPTP